MKKQILMSLLMFAMFVSTAFAVSVTQELDFQEPSTVVLWLTPVLTLAVTWLIKKVSPFISGTVTLIAVPVVSALIAWVSGLIMGEGSWTIQFLAGVGSVFLHQFYRFLTEPK